MKRLILPLISVAVLSGCVSQGAMNELYSRCVDRFSPEVGKAVAKNYCLCGAEIEGSPRAWYLLGSSPADLSNRELDEVLELTDRIKERNYCT